MPEFPCAGPITATLRVATGDLRVTAEPRTTVEVDVRPGSAGEAARSAAANTRVEMVDGALLVEVPHARGFVIRRTPPLHISVRVPLDSRVHIRSSSADITCAGRLSTADINSASGDLRLEHLTGDLDRHAASGDTEIGRVDGNATIAKASGDLRLGSVGGDLVARSASGDLAIESVGGSVKITTASGDIRVGTVVNGMTRINAASGDVTVGVAEGTAVWLDLSSASGTTRSDLAVSDAPPAGTEPTLNLSIRTASGDITVRRSPGHRVAPIPAAEPQFQD
jgi:DUF4097 and DUF4098 domain-containing protein YvlB